jgi:hypothetical protein
VGPVNVTTDPPYTVTVDLRVAANIVLGDLHEEFGKASKLLDLLHNGATRNVDQRIELIDSYSKAVARVIESAESSDKEKEPEKFEHRDNDGTLVETAAPHPVGFVPRHEMKPEDRR